MLHFYQNFYFETNFYNLKIIVRIWNILFYQNIVYICKNIFQKNYFYKSKLLYLMKKQKKKSTKFEKLSIKIYKHFKIINNYV